MKVNALLFCLLAASMLLTPGAHAIPMESTAQQPEKVETLSPEEAHQKQQESLSKRREAYAKYLAEQGMTTPTMLTTTRPAIAVGTLIEINPGTVTLAIDAGRSALPRAMRSHTESKDKLEAIKREEFPAQRTFKLTPHTLYVDARETGRKQVAATSGNLQKDTGLIKKQDFAVGDHVSVIFRMQPAKDPSDYASAINLSKVAADRTYFSPDYDPARGKKFATTRHTTSTLHSSPTLHVDRRTSATSMSQLLAPPRIVIPGAPEPALTAKPTPTPNPTPAP